MGDGPMAMTHLDVLVGSEFARTNNLTVSSCIASCSLNLVTFGLSLIDFIQLDG
jgi:hypothetical protein